MAARPWLRDPFQCTGLGILVTCLLEDYRSDDPFATDFEMKCRPYESRLKKKNHLYFFNAKEKEKSNLFHIFVAKENLPFLDMGQQGYKYN